ncbi:MAG: response regulator [Zetaproteobacteria bacterium CG12_big_fil_rev_8_21_14_0_65_55_1124]|nr:MAG: response regulator [Zetaproteobacteria bacterium CG1_02_55_237]PIS18715.1 MAG: response regulator [Zetaproteobacteria bacterium CG08_land_8_20_14_0_20_55_17]PIW43946.1 MAG: response regulator [Zetaproteobacteria bacterium CG12_big_fil_rev_8_21_14_0_65_55_1124]PIY52442.1 MAG: response regulator [Zetaproteobacteria bacterium CG_4_10_14_0_8_um_filter_55_43]PIZ36721.1 MAG: response regulator [Zetaproteobacteria bacterium CG_4_10_14_0_2_um_filter_55_20]PJB81035.1 MAG: response regulator [Ze
MKILIVDDSKAMRMIVSRTLRQAGYGDHESKEANDGVEALGIAREWQPDLIISDWNMPNMNGIEFLQALKGEGFSTPFGFVTTEGSAQMRQTAEEAGAKFLITKPFTADTFKTQLGPILSA